MYSIVLQQAYLNDRIIAFEFGGAPMSMEKYTPDELAISDTTKDHRGNTVQLFTHPITPKENYLRLYQGKTPMWIPFNSDEHNMIRIDCDPENQARSPSGGIDGYGVEWVWVAAANGAMVKPGAPKVADIEEWEKYITIPDPDTWDWEGCYERNKHLLNPDRLTMIGTSSCMFERLIAVMDFAEAAVALIDDDQKEAVHRFFRAVTDSRKKFYYHCKKWFNADIANFNDDWGSQRAEFFSYDTAREMLFPYVKEVGDYVHSLGMYFDLHCCGFVESFVPLFIEEGFNSWGGQPMNDKFKLKNMYGDKMVFTHGFDLPDNATHADIDAAVAEFMSGIGADNRVLFFTHMNDQYLRERLYEESRKNYDRLLAEGKAIL